MTTSPSCISLLHNHAGLSERRRKSNEKLAEILGRIEIEKSDSTNIFNLLQISLFGAGSIGRKEIGTKSDLDIFIIADGKIATLDQYKLFAKIIQINNDLNFPDFSNDGQFLKIHELMPMINALGSPDDDSENFFTTRMLLILEGVPLCNSYYFDSHLQAVVSHYFRDADTHNNDFKPLFLLNDLLRFWRTLCMNYEQIRNRTDKPWRKKNINLKFSRMLTVFATVLQLVVRRIEIEELKELCKLPPLERLAGALDHLSAKELTDRFSQFLDDYEFFLALKEKDDIEGGINVDKDLKNTIDIVAERFSTFLFDCLTHKNIRFEYRKFLVI
jgi:predicted nucleotidyltransferase